MVNLNEKREIYQAMMWNLEQLAENAINIHLSFRLGEITITMLESGIINPDLIDITTFKKIISEGLNVFTELEFPL
jgi:hypothetical protein